MKANKLKLVVANVKMPIPVHEAESRINSFMNWCKGVNSLYPHLCAEDILQIDEIATTTCGSMRNNITVAVGASEQGPHVARACALDDDKKFCTCVHFLHPRYIPPLVIIK